MLAWLRAAFRHEAEVESYLDTTEGVLMKIPVHELPVESA